MYLRTNITMFIVLLAFFSPIISSESASNEAVEIEPPERVTLAPALKRVCSCESTGHPDRTPTHYEKDGKTVLRGKLNSQDVGICQINLKWNGAAAKKLGLNLFKEEDNIKYANWLYKNEGLKPWKWSKSCWG